MSSPDRYPILSLNVESEPVYFETGAGDLLGFLKLHGRGENQKRVYRVRVDHSKTYDLPDHFTPWTWRPVKPERWPAPLPEPVAQSKKPKRPPEPHRGPPESREQMLWWESPDFRLGAPGEPPENLRECEARILRAWRTSDLLGRADQDRKHLRGSREAWPEDLRIAANFMEAMLKRDGRNARLREEDYTDFWTKADKSDSRERPVRWTPTRRDIGDIEPPGVLEWLRGLSPRDKAILNLRTDQPPFSWEEIAQVDIMGGRARQVIQRRYRKIIEQAFRKATA